MLITSACILHAQSFETATEAVKNMGVGWNLGNTLDANSQNKDYWDETKSNFWGQQGLDSETCWGQPYTKPELMKIMKEAGFGAIRVPVTWYNHMDANGKVDVAWMARVHEVVDYVINQGLYCILNVHHDTGSDVSDGKQVGRHWLHASTNSYNKAKAKYEYLWKQIAEEFKNYGEKLLFESYNEMLDDYNSWCFATFARSGGHHATEATDVYNAINSYAQSFVDVVRATGGNNAKRNLVVNTYCASNGGGHWNSHLQDPLKEMKLPTDATAGSGHIAFEVHAYPTLASGKSETDDLINQLNSYLLTKGPVIMGEWGTSNVDQSETDYAKDPEKYLEFVQYFVEKTKAKNIATFYWMGLSDGLFRSNPVFTQPDIAKTIVKSFYGNADSYQYPEIKDITNIVCFEGEKVINWGDGISIASNLFAAFDKSIKLLITFSKQNSGYSDIQFHYGDWGQKASFTIDGKTYSGDYGPNGEVGASQTITVTFDESIFNTLTKKGLIVHGTGIVITKIELKSGTTDIGKVLIYDNQDPRIYNLQGQQVSNPQHGIFIQNGKKYVVR